MYANIFRQRVSRNWPIERIVRCVYSLQVAQLSQRNRGSVLAKMCGRRYSAPNVRCRCPKTKSVALYYNLSPLYTKKATSRFWASFVGFGAMYIDTLFILAHWKTLDFLLVTREPFSLRATVETLRLEVGVFQGDGSIWPKISGRMGNLPFVHG